MKKEGFTDIARRRVVNWLMQNDPIKKGDSWTETRLAIDFKGHTFLLSKDQIFQCGRCGQFDPEWSVTEVLRFFEMLGIKPYEVEVTCTLS